MRTFASASASGSESATTAALSTASRRGELGSVTAEFAVVVPAVLLLLGLALGAVALTAQSVRCQAAAAAAARALGRDDPSASAAASLRAPGSTMAVARHGDLVCVTVSTHGRGALAGIAVSGSSCALTGGR